MEETIIIMIKTPLLAATAALLVLSACQNNPEEVGSSTPDPQAEALKNAPKIELPPSIKASQKLRCADNSVISVDFFDGDKMVVFRDEKGAVTMLKAENAGDPFVAEGFKLTGSPKSVTVETPSGTRTCRS